MVIAWSLNKQNGWMINSFFFLPSTRCTTLPGPVLAQIFVSGYPLVINALVQLKRESYGQYGIYSLSLPPPHAAHSIWSFLVQHLLRTLNTWPFCVCYQFVTQLKNSLLLSIQGIKMNTLVRDFAISVKASHHLPHKYVHNSCSFFEDSKNLRPYWVKNEFKNSTVP